MQIWPFFFPELKVSSFRHILQIPVIPQRHFCRVERNIFIFFGKSLKGDFLLTDRKMKERTQ